MTWPQHVYIAANAKGVYHTADFVSEAPTWAAENDGLGALTVHSFQVDPHNGYGYQWAVTQEWCVYRRTMGGAWAPILTQAQVVTLADDEPVVPVRVFCDATIAGRVWVLAGRTEASFPAYTPAYWALRSNDYGNTWSAYSGPDTLLGTNSTEYQGCAFVGDYGLYTYSPGANQYVAYTSDGGETWDDVAVSGGHNYASAVFIHPLAPTYGYFTSQGTGDTRYLYRVSLVDGALTQLVQIPEGWGVQTCGGSLWYDPTDPLYQRAYSTDRLYRTTDGWATHDTFEITSVPSILASWQDTSAPERIVAAETLLNTPTLPTYGVWSQETEGLTRDAKKGNLPGDMGTLADWGLQAIALAPGHWQVYSCRYEEVS